VVFSARCEPARSTALAVCEACGATWKEVADFRNLDHGLWQGLCVDDVRRKFPKVFKQWQESPETVCLPEGETLAEAVERLQRALRKCLKRKRSIGIVASEPLATLIGCLLRGCRPELPVSAQDCPEQRIEFLKVAVENWEKEAVGDLGPLMRGNGESKRDANGKGRPVIAGNGNGSSHGAAANHAAASTLEEGEKNGAGKNNGVAGMHAASKKAAGPSTGSAGRSKDASGGNGSSHRASAAQEAVE
jgi:broad specificity phosphatase PhoE